MISFLNTKPPMAKPTKIDELEKTEQKMQQFFAPKEDKRPVPPLTVTPVTLAEPKPPPPKLTPAPPVITPAIPEPEKLTEDNVMDYFQNKYEPVSNEALEVFKALAQKNPVASLITYVPIESYQPIINTYTEPSSKRKHTQLIEANEVGRLNLFTHDNKRKRVDVTI